mgnify:CR=1 FL=1
MKKFTSFLGKAAIGGVFAVLLLAVVVMFSGQSRYPITITPKYAKVGSWLTVGDTIRADAIAFSGTATIAIPTGAATLDTLKVANASATFILVRGATSPDSVHTITGMNTGQLYVLSAVADDTTIALVDGGNLKLSATFNMDALTDRVIGIYDGTNFVQISTATND